MQQEVCMLSYMNLYNSILKNTDFNFDSKYYFSVKIDNKMNTKRYTLYVKKRNKLEVPNGFYGNNITSFNMLVGKNGSGKTMTFQCIRENICGGITSLNGEGIIYVIKINDTYVVDTNCIHFNIVKEVEDIKIMQRLEYESKYNKKIRKIFNKTIFYSNYFGSQANLGSHSDVINISKDLIVNEVYSKKNMYPQGISIQKVLNNAQNMLILQCINDSKINTLEKQKFLKIPNLIHIYSYDTDENRSLFSERKDNFLSDKWIGTNRINSYIDNLGRVENENRLGYEAAINKFIVSILLVWKEKEKINEKQLKLFIKRLGSTKRKDAADMLIHDIIKDKYEIEGAEKSFWIKFLNYIKEQQNRFVLWNQLDDDFLIRMSNDTIFDEEIVKNLLQYCDCELVNSTENRNGMYSSGNQSKLSMWAYMYKAYKEIKENESDNKNILLLLDEISAYYHPEYQVNTVKELIEMIEVLFEEYNVQVIMATHTPLEISDISSENIIYLDECSNNYYLNEVNTFGADISSLFKNSFFLDLPMGTYAQAKINSAITMLNEEIDINKDEVKYIISILGDNLLKNKLADMYYDKFPEEKNVEFMINNYKKKIIELENEIQKLNLNNKKTDY